ncbi:hypothetical protein PGB90_008282 [Kerria lacca]
MSASTKKKHVINEMLDDHCYIRNNQQLVKVLSTKGNHLYEVKSIKNEIFLVSMPSKFRNTVWIKAGSYVIVETIDEGKKVKGEIVYILLKHHIKQMKKEKNWPAQFDNTEISNWENVTERELNIPDDEI